MSLLGRIRWKIWFYRTFRGTFSLRRLLRSPFSSVSYRLSKMHYEKKQEQVCQKLGFSSVDEIKAHAEDLTPLLDIGNLWLCHSHIMDNSGMECYHLTQIEDIRLGNGREWRTKLIPYDRVYIKVRGVRCPLCICVPGEAEALAARLLKECADCGNVLDRSYAPFRKSAAQPA